MIETDILIEPDLKISEGDFWIETSTNENIKYLLIANPGNFLASPVVGVGIYKYQNAAIQDARDLNNSIKTQLKNDGYSDIQITGQFNRATQSTELKVTAERITKPLRVKI